MPRPELEAVKGMWNKSAAPYLSGFRGMGGHLRRSWSVSWPMIFIMAFEFIITLTDVFIAGLLGKEFQAAVGFSTQIYFIFIVVANALTVGTVSVASRLFSGGRKDELGRTVFSVSAAVLGAGVLFGAGGVFLSPCVMSRLGMPSLVMDLAVPLVRMYSIGLPFHYLLINGNGILRATGGVKKSMATMALVCVCNVALNYLFVFHTSLGYLGIALSTAVSVVIGAIKNQAHIFPFVKRIHMFSKGLLGDVARIGWPTAVQQLSWHMGSTVMFLILASLPGNTVAVMAAYTNGLRIEAAIFLPAYALNMANAVVVGNMLGAGREKDAFRGGIATALIATGLISVMTVIIVLHARPLASLLSGDGRVISECARYLIISMISEPFMAWGVVLGGGLNGAGDTRTMMLVITGSFWLVRIPLAFFFGVVLGLGAPAVWWAMNASIAVNALLISMRFFGRRWIR